MKISQRALNLLERGQIPDATEDVIQTQIVTMLRLKGCEVLITSRRRKRCAKCNSYSSGGDGVSKGTPDLLVRMATWPKYFWVGLEVKSASGRFSCDEQKRLAEIGATAVVRSVEDAVKVLDAVKIGD